MLANMTGAAYEAEMKALDAYATITAKDNFPHALELQGLIPLRNYISERLGLHYDDDRLNVLHHRLSPLAAAGGFGSLAEYYQHIRESPGGADRLHRLASQLTNNETYFFRETGQLNALIQSLLPGMVQKKLLAPHKKLRVLSAGCSTGEEAFTVAMLLEEAGLRGKGCGVEVLGMDIDPVAVAAAREGRYPSRSFRGGESVTAQKYFTRENDLFVARDTIKNMVRFTQGNLLEARDLGGFDVIFCRNVLIYFSDSSMERVAKNFYDMLIPGGYLLLGHSESFCRINTDFVPIRLEGAVVYQKQ